MSAPQSAAVEAIAFQLAAALEKYATDTTAMIEGWPDLELYRSVSDEVEKIRMYSSALPETRVQWVELLIAHAELIHFLWRMQYGKQRDAQTELVNVREHHADCIAALRQRCMRAMDRKP